MGFMADIQEAAEGRRKAKRDIELHKMFMDEHGNDPESSIAARFYASLGDDVAHSGTVEHDVYSKLTKKFQVKYRTRFMKLKFKELGMSRTEWRAYRKVDRAAKSVERARAKKRKKIQVIPVEQLLKNPDVASAFASALIDALVDANPELREKRDERLRENRDAGECVGCGGPVNDDGYCMGEFGGGEQ